MPVVLPRALLKISRPSGWKAFWQAARPLFFERGSGCHQVVSVGVGRRFGDAIELKDNIRGGLEPGFVDKANFVRAEPAWLDQ